MALFQIGPFDFINLSRPPSLPKQQMEREVRPGVEGVTFWGTGRRSTPYELVSVRDVEDVLEGLLLLDDYQQIVGTGPVQLVWGGYAHGRVLVHDVESLEGGVHRTLLGVGGLRGVSGAMLRCHWVLEHVPVLLQSGGD
jgi:hypothetical protein